jgi:predicted DCC family thiol-disulfide oxidoreductase YuxK
MASEVREHAPAGAAAARTRVLYDGQCEFCRRSIGLLRRLDWLGRLEYLDARDPAQRPAGGPALDPGRLLEEMHVVTPDGRRVYHGFAALRQVAWRLPPLWPLAPLLYLPGVPQAGQRLYLWVARNRFRLVPCHGGVCSLPGAATEPPNHSEPRTPNPELP